MIFILKILVCLFKQSLVFVDSSKKKVWFLLSVNLNSLKQSTSPNSTGKMQKLLSRTYDQVLNPGTSAFV